MAAKIETTRVAIGLALGLWGATASLAEPPPPAMWNPEEPLPQERIEELALVDQTSLESERAINELVRHEFGTGHKTAGRFGNRQLIELPIRQAALYALRKSIDIQRRYVGEDIAQAALREAEAVFNPVLLFSFNYDRSETFKRVQRDRVFVPESKNQPIGTGNTPGRVVPIVDQNTSGQVDARKPRVERVQSTAAHFTTESFLASQASSSLPVPVDSRSYNAQIFQQLPWGSNLTLAYQVLDQEKLFSNNSSVPEFATSGSYHRPWLSSFIANLSLPVPGSKDFGPYAEQDIGIKFADLGRERAFWLAESAINTTLRDMEVGYWELIRALLSLRITVENLHGLEKLVERTNKLYELRIATNYDKAQVEAELARLQSQEESAWNAYVVASNALVRLLNLDESQVLLPVGYSQALAHAVSSPQDLDTLASQGSLDNPDLAQSSVDVKAARIEQERRAVRTRPDVRLTARINGSQSGRFFGYRNLGDSIGNTFDPDIFQQTYTLEYVYPWRNQEVKARLAQAEAATTRQELTMGLTNNRIYREINNARIGLTSAEEQVKIATRNVKLSELVYEKSVAQRDVGAVTEYEIVQQNQRLLTARLNQIQARTALKQAEAQLLAALGILPRAYPERTAQTALDRYRLDVLAANHALRYFGDGP